MTDRDDDDDGEHHRHHHHHHHHHPVPTPFGSGPPAGPLNTMLMWRGAPIGPPQVPSLVTRAAAKGILYGGTVNFHYLNDLDYQKYLVSEYAGGIIAIETGATMANIESTQGSFSFANSDQCLNVFPANAKPTMRWYLFPGYPSWMAAQITTRAGAISVMQQYINALAAKYPYPAIKYIILFNECIKPVGGQDSLGFVADAFKTVLGNGYTGASTAAGTAGYIACAYDFCRTAFGPQVKLGLNFNHHEPEESDDTTTRNQVLACYQGMKNAGRPLDWFGNEFHGNMGVVVPSQSAMAAYYANLANLGAELHATEIDCNDHGFSGNNDTRDTAAPTNIMPSLTTLMNNAACTCIQTWLDNDRYNWEVYPPMGRGNPSGAGSGGIGRTDNIAGRTTPKDWMFRKKSVGTWYDQIGALIDASGSGGLIRKDVTVIIGQQQFIISPLGVSSASAVGTVTVSVQNNTTTSGTGPGPNQPAGMFVGLDTGNLTVPPVTPTQVAAGTTTWRVGGSIVSTWQQSAPATKDSSGDWAGNFILCPDAPGYRIIYDPTLQGGASPTRPGVPVNLPTNPTGSYYVAARYRIGGANANWKTVGSQGTAPVGIKLFSLHDRNSQGVSGTGTNHIFNTMWDTARTGSAAAPDIVFTMMLQGPNSQSSFWPTTFEQNYSAGSSYAIGKPVIGTDGNHYTAIATVPPNTPPPNAAFWRVMAKHFSPYYNAQAYLNATPPVIPIDGQFHLLELLTQGESVPGAGDGQITLWVDNSLLFHVEGILFLATGDLPGLSFIQFDPTWGGQPNPADGPAQTQYVDVNGIYVSQK